MARRHIVICAQCGRQFDVNKGGFYNNQSRRYTCLNCGNRIKREANNRKRAENAARRRALADEREQRTGMRQSIGAMTVKIILGILLIRWGLPSNSPGVLLLIGVALLAWGLIPFVKAKLEQSGKSIKSIMPSLSSLKFRKTDHSSPSKQYDEREQWICRWCGATTSGNTCEFCGRARGK